MQSLRITTLSGYISGKLRRPHSTRQRTEAIGLGHECGLERLTSTVAIANRKQHLAKQLTRWHDGTRRHGILLGCRLEIRRRPHLR